MRIGVLSDIHCELEPAGSRWINPFASDRLDAMSDAALAWFATERVDLVLLLGDIVQFPQLADLEHVFARLAAATSVPLLAVNGNHDIRLGEAFARAAHRHGVSLLFDAPQAIAGVDLQGIELERGPIPPQYQGRAGGEANGSGVAVVASHFPLLSEALRVAGAGIPYAGDLVNRAELELRLTAAQRPTVVLSGHIHARCTTHASTLLQFTVGALIEPPYDATIVEVDPTGGRVRRTARRLGDVAPIDPVFAPDEEAWEWDGRWHPTHRAAHDRRGRR